MSSKALRWLRQDHVLSHDNEHAGIEIIPISFLASSFLTAQALRNERLSKVLLQGSILIGFENKRKWAEVKHQRIDWATRLSAKHVQFNWKSDIFETSNRAFLVSVVSRSLVKGSEDSGYEDGNNSRRRSRTINTITLYRSYFTLSMQYQERIRKTANDEQ